MSDERFVVSTNEIGEIIVTDVETGNVYHYGSMSNFLGLIRLLNEQEQKIQRWKNLYELKDAEVTARVDALNEVCEYYTSEVLFKSDVDPNEAVKEVINRILNTEVKW